MTKRLFDIIIALTGLIILSPFLILIYCLILTTSGVPVIYNQLRVGRNDKDFRLYKFRSMYINADQHGLLTTGSGDKRITKVGRILRKYKLDELPQLWNVLKGNMSIVGPRPEVRKFVNLYSDEEKLVLSVRPGLTDYASLAYFNENEVLENYPDSEKAYIEIIMPAKLKLNLKYIGEAGLSTDLKVIGKTMVRIFSQGSGSF